MTQIRASEAVLSEDTYVAVDTPAFVGAPAPSFLCLEWCAFGRCTETASKIDRASDNGNARRREPPSILLYNYGFLSGLRLIRTGSSGLPLFDAVRSSA